MVSKNNFNTKYQWNIIKKVPVSYRVKKSDFFSFSDGFVFLRDDVIFLREKKPQVMAAAQLRFSADASQVIPSGAGTVLHGGKI